MKIAADRNVKESLKRCLKTILQLVELDVIELWTRGQNGFSLHYIYRNDIPNSSDCNRSGPNDEESIKLCEKSIDSTDGFFFTVSKVDPRFSSRICLHLPRENVNADVFFVGYSTESRQFGGSKLNLYYWLAHSACAIAFAADASEIAHSSSNNVLRLDAVRALQESVDISFVEVKDETTKKAVSQHFTKQINVHPDSPLNGRALMEDLNLSVVCDVMTPSRRADRDKNSSSRSLVRPPSTSSINTGSPTVSVRAKRNSVSSPNGSIRGSSGSNVRQENTQHSPFKGDDRKESDWYSGTDQPGSNTPSRTEGSISSSAGPMSSNITLGSALTSITGITRTKPLKPQRPEKTFDFNIIDLPLLRDINRRVDLNEMSSLEYITGGSHSQIYSATWHGQSVIVKILSEQKANHTVAIHEFDVECELLARLDHPNIASILGGGVIPRPFIIMERLRDMSEILNLSQQETNPVMFKNKVFKYIEVLQLARDLAIALRYLHSEVHSQAMIIHRDLKPENLGLGPDGSLKLFDFGLCRCVRIRGCESDKYEMTGNTGSLRYMAPEVVLGKPYTEKVDVYSFAMIMWTFARNKSPFKGFDRAMHRARVVGEGERPKMDSDWPADFVILLEACWHQNSDHRPSFTAITAQLEKMISTYIKDPTGLKTKTKGLSFLKTMFSKR